MCVSEVKCDGLQWSVGEHGVYTLGLCVCVCGGCGVCVVWDVGRGSCTVEYGNELLPRNVQV